MYLVHKVKDRRDLMAAHRAHVVAGLHILADRSKLVIFQPNGSQSWDHRDWVSIHRLREL